MTLLQGRRVRSSLALAALLLLVSAVPTQADGWSLWKPTETVTDDGLGGTPYASSKKTRSTGFAPTSSSTSSDGWNIGAGMTNVGKSVVNGTANAMSKTASVTKKVAKKTVDVVTLKPLWASKPAPSPFQLGSHPDPRSKKSNNKPAFWGTSSKSEPSTPSQFFSQPRVR